MSPNRLQVKIAFWAGICLIVISAAIISYSAVAMHKLASETRQNAVSSAKKYAATVARQHAYHIRAELEIALDAARTLAHALSTLKDKNISVQLGREEVNGILKNILRHNPDFVGVYTLWEPTAFDGLDTLYQNTTGHDETGRFIPYWSRGENGIFTVEPLVDYETPGPGDYYQLPKKRKTEQIISPYMYPIQGKKTLITSLVVPVISDKTFYGIAGVDLRLDLFQEIVDNNQQLYDGTARITIISHDNTIVSATGKPGLAGKPAKTILPYWQKHKHKIGKTTHVEKEDDTLCVVTPIIPGSTNTPWYVDIRIPFHKITEQADRMLARTNADIVKMLGIGGMIAIAALAVLWFVAGGIAKPVRETAERLKDVAQGEGDLTRRIDTESKDEVGEMGLWFNHFMASLQEIIIDIKSITRNLNSSSQEIDSISEKMAEQAKEMKDQSGDVAGATEEMSGNINTMASAIEELSVNVQSVSSTAEQMSHNMISIVNSIDHMTTSIENIAEKAIESAETASKAMEKANTATLTMSALGDAARQIGEVTGVIKRIAEQTNLLALNATIEAASAGDAGKGFAVVAGEIKELANQSAMSAENISGRISSIQEHTEKAVGVIQEVSDIIGIINMSLGSISISVEQQSVNANDISQNAEEVKNGAGNIAASISEISKGTNDMAKNATEAANGVNYVAATMQSVNQAAKESEKVSLRVKELTKELHDICTSLMSRVEQFRV